MADAMPSSMFIRSESGTEFEEKTYVRCVCGVKFAFEQNNGICPDCKKKAKLPKPA